MATITDPETKEYRRLRRLFKGLPKNKLAIAEGLLHQAARTKVQLDNLYQDIAANGNTEFFSQSDKTDPYERERPASAIYAKLDKNYQAIIKQLNDMMPPPDESDDSLDNFRINS